MQEVEITDNRLRGLIQNPQVRRIAPSIREAYENARTADCGTCGRKKAESTAGALNAARNAIASLSSKTLSRLKELLGASTLVVRIRSSAGKKSKQIL